MERKRENCIYHRCEDGCKWCELGKTCSDNMFQSCASYAKRLTIEESQRVVDLQQVWDYLYKKRVYSLCDYISREIGLIKGTIKEDEKL